MKNTDDLLLLLLDQEGYQPASYFAKETGFSIKTIYKYFDQLKGSIKNEGLTITSSQRKGFKLEGNIEVRQSMKAFLKSSQPKVSDSSFSLNYRRLYLFSQLLFSQKVNTFEYYADKFFVSPQSIKKDFDSIVEFLSARHAYTKREKTGIKIYASEQQIELIFKNYLEKYEEKNSLSNDQKEKLFGKNVISVVDNFINQTINLTVKPPNDYTVFSLNTLLIIALKRLESGKHFDKDSSLLFDKIENLQFYITIIDLSKEANDRLGINLGDSDIYYLSSLLFAHGIGPVIKNSDKNQKIQYEVKTLVKAMSEVINCDLEHDEYLAQSLLSHIIPMVYRLKVGVEIKNPLKREIIAQYSTMFTLVSYKIIRLEKRFDIRLTEDELSFITIHFQLAFEKVQKVKHLLIVCPVGLGTSQLVYQRVKQRLPYNNVLEIVNLKELKRTDLSHVDLVISTVKLSKISVPIVYVSPLPTNKEMAVIDEKLSNININEKKFINQRQGQSFLISNLTPEFIFINPPVVTMEELVIFLSNKYEEMKITTSNFRQAVLDRESIGTTGLFSGAAIPHADPSTVKKTQISITCLKKPIVWGENKVSLVILLAIAEKDVSDAKEMVASIYSLLSSIEAVQLIVSSKTEQEVIELITSMINN
ncbi:MAG TPA: PTS sugar transporter subunit IIA [Lactovum miscens]|uniref:BglG family transcription antiterminator n=1 Tax=Lactovum miscens TaxID=190387 RepID=UPI002EDABD97